MVTGNGNDGTSELSASRPNDSSRADDCGSSAETDDRNHPSSGSVGLSLPGELSLPLRFLDSCLSWIFQTECVVCGIALHGKGVCDPCGELKLLSNTLCDRCGDEWAEAISRCGRCSKDQKKYLDKARSTFWLRDSHLSLFHRIKYLSEEEWLGLYRSPILNSFAPFFSPDFVLVPVPLHWRRHFRRGFNQAEIFARWVGEGFGYEVSAHSFVKEKATRAQSELGKKERLENLKGAFRWRNKNVPEKILLIDDIFTTGSTLEECARVLKREGAQTVYAWTPFRTPRQKTLT
jgi:ComF family protein